MLLADFYGEMLTEKQREFIGYYYGDDLSLSEIAENTGISRQGARDTVKRAEAILREFESKLGLAERYARIRDGLIRVGECADRIHELNLDNALSIEINDLCVEIKSLCTGLSEAESGSAG